MINGRILAVLVAVGVVVGWSVPGRADDEDEGPAAQPAPPPDEPADHGDTPDPEPPQVQPAAGDDPAAPAGAEDHDEGSGAAAVGADHDDGSAADADHDGTPDSAEDADHDGTPDAIDTDDDNDGTPDTQEAGAVAAGDDHGDAAGGGGGEDDDGEPPYVEYDTDGDGVVEPGEAAFQQEYQAAFAGIPDEITDAALDARDNATELAPSLSADQFRTLVRLAKAKVLPRLEAKMARKQAKRMLSFTYLVCGFSLLGVLLLFSPLLLRKKHPGQGPMLFKYAALAAVTWLVTVNLFGGVLYGMRTAQSALSSYTNPQLAIAGGLFDTLDEHAEDYLVMGKELFAPTLEQLQGNADQQPAATLIENGMKIVHDAKVFKSMGSLFKKVDWLFGLLPIILLGVTLLLFALAIKPTLIEIIKLPTRAAAGDRNAGRDVMRTSMRRIVGELKATVATLGVLAVLTLVSAFVLGKVVGPALDGLLQYFSLAVTYLQFTPGASSGLVFCTLFGVIFFLVLNLATLILSTAFFLGKSQKIFQQRFNDGVPVARHKRFFQWGVPAVIGVQLFPLVFVVIAQKALAAINASLMSGATSADDINWTLLMLAGPLFLVFAYIVVFWAARGLKAIKFLQGYKVKDALKAGELPRATAL